MTDDEKDDSARDWPPKRSGRRKIADSHPALDVESAEGEEAPPSGRLELPGGIALETAMKRAFEQEGESSSVDVLGGVQGRLRERSGGKFYGDGWSTTRHPPFATFFITSLLMLAVMAAIYAILVPIAGDPIELPREPQPINVIPPN